MHLRMMLSAPSVNTMTYADGAPEARSRQEEEDDAWPSSTTTNTEIAHKSRLEDEGPKRQVSSAAIDSPGGLHTLNCLVHSHT